MKKNINHRYTQETDGLWHPCKVLQRIHDSFTGEVVEIKVVGTKMVHLYDVIDKKYGVAVKY